MFIMIQCIFVSLSRSDRLTEDADYGKKKSSFQMKLILILESHRAYIEKPTHPNKSLFAAGFIFFYIFVPFEMFDLGFEALHQAY